MDPSKLLKDLKLNKIRNIIIYTSFIILVISLLFPLQGLESVYVQKASLSFFIYGIFLWGIERVALPLLEGVNDIGAFGVVFIWIALVIIGFLMVFKIAFGLELIEIIGSWR